MRCRRRPLLGPGLLDGVLGLEDVEVGAAARALEVDALEVEPDLGDAAALARRREDLRAVADAERRVVVLSGRWFWLLVAGSHGGRIDDGLGGFG